MADSEEDIKPQTITEVIEETVIIASAIQMVQDMKDKGAIHHGSVNYDSDERVVNIDIHPVVPAKEIEISILIHGESDEEETQED